MNTQSSCPSFQLLRYLFSTGHLFLFIPPDLGQLLSLTLNQLLLSHWTERPNQDCQHMLTHALVACPIFWGSLPLLPRLYTVFPSKLCLLLRGCHKHSCPQTQKRSPAQAPATVETFGSSRSVCIMNILKSFPYSHRSRQPLQ